MPPPYGFNVSILNALMDYHGFLGPSPISLLPKQNLTQSKHVNILNALMDYHGFLDHSTIYLHPKQNLNQSKQIVHNVYL